MAADSDGNGAMPDLVLDIENEDDDQTFTNQEAPSSSTKSNKSLVENPIPSTSQQADKLNGKSLSVDEPKSMKTETPRRSQTSNSRGGCKMKHNDSETSVRSCEQHTFLTDITEVRQMEQGLLKLLDDFHSGKLQAFGRDCTFEKMEHVREQQERLARLHFELNAQQEMYGQSEDGRRIGRENLAKLIENLQQLSRSIEQLQISSPSMQTDV